MTEHDRQLRTSLYLVRRADAMLGALKFFASTANDARDRKLQFMAQSDFWEWEIDNLIYSFTNLAERSKTWVSGHAIREKLGQLGIAVDAKLLKRARWRDRWQLQRSRSRVAPMDLLREVIETWNALIEEVDVVLIAPMKRDAERWNIDTRTDLKSLVKSMPQIDLESDQEE